MADSEVKDIKVKKEKPVMVLPEDIEGKEELALLEAGSQLGLGVPTEDKVNNYFMKPGVLAADRKKKSEKNYCDDTAKASGYKE